MNRMFILFLWIFWILNAVAPPTSSPLSIDLMRNLLQHSPMMRHSSFLSPLIAKVHDDNPSYLYYFLLGLRSSWTLQGIWNQELESAYQDRIKDLSGYSKESLEHTVEKLQEHPQELLEPLTDSQESQPSQPDASERVVQEEWKEIDLHDDLEWIPIHSWISQKQFLSKLSHFNQETIKSAFDKVRISDPQSLLQSLQSFFFKHVDTMAPSLISIHLEIQQQLMDFIRKEASDQDSDFILL